MAIMRSKRRAIANGAIAAIMAAPTPSITTAGSRRGTLGTPSR
jgi:hypothetical protein